MKAWMVLWAKWLLWIWQVTPAQLKMSSNHYYFFPGSCWHIEDLNNIIALLVITIIFLLALVDIFKIWITLLHFYYQVTKMLEGKVVMPLVMLRITNLTSQFTPYWMFVRLWVQMKVVFPSGKVNLHACCRTPWGELAKFCWFRAWYVTLISCSNIYFFIFISQLVIKFNFGQFLS